MRTRTIAAVAFAFLSTISGPAHSQTDPVRLVPQVSRGAARGRATTDGHYAVRWLGGTELSLWDHVSGMYLGRLTPPRGTSTDCAISPDGRYLAFEAPDEIVIEDLDTGAIRRIGPIPGTVTGVWFSRDGTRVFAAHVVNPLGTPRDHGVSLWNFADGEMLSTFSTPVESSGFLGHGHFAPGASPDELYWPTRDEIRRYDMTGAGVVERIAVPEDLQGTIAFAVSTDGKRAVSRHIRASGQKRDGVLAYWNWSERKVIGRVPLFEPRHPWISPVYDELAISPNGGHVVVRVPRVSVRLYRFGEDAPVTEVVGEPDLLAFTGDSERVIIGTSIRNAATGKLVMPEIPVLPGYETEVAMHGGLAFVVRGTVVSAWDMHKLERRWSRADGLPSGKPRSAVVSPDGATLTVRSPTSVRVFDAATGALDSEDEPTARAGSTGLDRVARTRHGSVSSTGGTLQFWAEGSDQPLATHVIDNDPRAVLAVAVSPDSNTVAAARADRTVQLFDASSGAEIRSNSLSKLGYVSELAVSDDRTWALVVVDGTPIAMNLARDASVRLIEYGDQWVIADGDGVFTASAGGGRLLAAASGRRGFHIDQLALSKNNPAKLMRALDVGNDEQRAYYDRLFRSRLRKAGVDAATVADRFESAPVARFGAVKQDAAHADLEIELEATRGLLRYNIDINGTPVFGAAGKKVSGKRQRVSERVRLGRGANRIELRVVDRAGVEGLRPVRLLEAASKQQSKLYFLGFGVSDYANTAYNLRYARKDVLDLAAALQHASAGFSKIETRVYIDAAVTPKQIKSAKEFVARAGVDDVVIVMIAGHGVHSDDDSAQYYFVTHGTDIARLAETAAPFEDIEALLDGIESRRKLFLMDTCESGERDPEAETAAIASAGSRGLFARTTRALNKVPADKPHEQRDFVLDRDRFLFNGILRRSGAVVFSSSRGTELSYETAELRNGVFTQSVLEALTDVAVDVDGDGRIAIDELRNYVAQQVATYTEGAQNPAIERDNLAADISLPVMTAAREIAGRQTAPRPSYVVSSGSPDPIPGRARSPRGCGCSAGTGSGVTLALLVVLGLLGQHRRQATRAARAGQGRWSSKFSVALVWLRRRS